MKILELRAENVKRLVAVEIHPGEDPIVEITGDNGAGKSSVLDCIRIALGGKEEQPPEIIRRGADNSDIELDLGDTSVDYTVKCRNTPSGRTLVVTSKDGARYPSPQALLDTFIGRLSFDPLAFIQLKPDKQQETVKKLVNVDTSAIEKEHEEAYAARTKITAEGKAMKARFDAMPVPGPDVPDEPVSVSALLDEQTRLQEIKSANDAQRATVLEAERQLASFDSALEEAKADCARLKALYEAAQSKCTKLADQRHEVVETIERRKAAVAELFDPDLTVIYKQSRNAEAINVAVAAKKARAELWKQLEAKREEAIKIDATVKALEAKKDEMIATAKFPINGMSFSKVGLTFNGLPLEQASKAEQLRVGMAMGLALNPKLRVVLIHDGSLLDSKSMKLVGELAAAAGAQVWIERVGSGKVGFEIVEGYVVSRDGVPVERPAQLTEANGVTTTISVPVADRPGLSLVPTPAKTPPAPAAPPPAAETKKVPTFKKRPIPELSGQELTAAIAEVTAAIDAAPLAPKSTGHRAKLEELKAEMNRRLEEGISGEPVESREPGWDG